MDRDITLSYKRFKKLNPLSDTFHGHTLDETWREIKEVLSTDSGFQSMIDHVLNDISREGEIEETEMETILREVILSDE